MFSFIFKNQISTFFFTYTASCLFFFFHWTTFIFYTSTTYIYFILLCFFSPISVSPRVFVLSPLILSIFKYRHTFQVSSRSLPPFLFPIFHFIHITVTFLALALTHSHIHTRAHTHTLIPCLSPLVHHLFLHHLPPPLLSLHQLTPSHPLSPIIILLLSVTHTLTSLSVCLSLSTMTISLIS